MQDINFNTLKKYGIYAAIVVIIVIAAIAIYKISKKFLVNELNQAQQEHINSLEIIQNEVSIPNAEMSNLVAKLKAAFGNWGWGTDEDAVYDVFESVNSRSDVLALVNAFGVYDDHTLNEWMNKELNSEELAHVQEILASKGIVYIF